MSTPTISAAALQAVADHGVPVDPGAQYGVEVARHCTTEALIAALRKRGYRVESATFPPVPMYSDDASTSYAAALLWFADEGHYEGTYRRGAGFAGACGMSIARKALGLPVDRPDQTMMPLAEALAQHKPTPAERTPLVVLRAMLAAYEKAALDACMTQQRAHKGARGITPEVRELCRIAIHRGEAVEIAREMLAAVLTNVDPKLMATESTWGDYEARLAGTRPLDAPPLDTK
ncbi:hypothetical protein [Erythrobacter sp.]|uniref:hypothetical protein n=1 Tax=Erythrobacter sp. TaxID=1042 RepID=UPI0031203CF6